MAYPPPADLLPHRPPMRLLRAVLSHQAGVTCCEGGFDPAFVAACGGAVPAAFGLELIAQAAAVHHALNQLDHGAQPARAARGLLLGSRRLQLTGGPLPADAPLRVTVVGGGDPPGPGGLIRFEGRVEGADGGLLAGGDATVLEWRPDPPVS